MKSLELIIILAIFFFTLLSSFISALQSAFSNLKISEIEKLLENNNRAKVLQNLLKSSYKINASLLLWDSLIIFIIGIFTIYLSLNFHFNEPHYLIIILITSFSFLSFMKIILQRIATVYSLIFSLRTSRILEILTNITYPVIYFFIYLTRPLIKISEIDLQKAVNPVTEEDIRLLVDVGEEQGLIEKEEKAMIYSVFEFGDTIVKEVMIPRIDMVCIEKNASLEEFIDITNKEGFSRIPVYEESIDNIIGVAYTKDLLNYLKDKKIEVSLKEIIRPTYFVPASKKVKDLFNEMQKKKTSIAIIVDEYGGTDGLVTMEDLIEEIFGEISDEYDQEVPALEKCEDGVFLIDAKMNIEDVNEKLEINLPSKDFETIGGFIYGLLDHVPKQGETIKYDNLLFTVDKVYRQRITKIKLSKKEKIESSNINSKS
ncbi:MAG: HlyC/CorC family transporter [Armatimonadetes bacterium]|nr:HlyC/CorC family transporter [Armatimonadota bacterium]